jgi:hypothetical protein
MFAVAMSVKNFLIGRCPSHLMNHWVWSSVTTNFVKPIACLAVLADLQSRALDYATTVESYLNNNNNVFPTVDSDNEKLDGCYLTLDTVMGHLIRSGFAEQGLGRRWKEHLRASHLTDRNTRDRPQYQFYPHESVGDYEAPNRRGTVSSQLQQKMAMGMRKCDADRILPLFNWTEIDEAMLTQLSYRSEGGGSLASKKYKHVCFMFELFFAVALEPSKNITNNPTCEWQLRLYSKRNT